MEELRKKCREVARVCFEGEVTVTKVNLWLALSTCLLAGILYGIRKAPFTHGVMIGSNNGNSFSCGSGRTGTADRTTEEKQEGSEEAGGEKQVCCGRKKSSRRGRHCGKN